MDIIPIQCPHCLGELEVNWDAGTAICLYCRGKMVIKRSFDPTKSPHANPMTAKQLSLTHLAFLLKKISQSSAANQTMDPLPLGNSSAAGGSSDHKQSKQAAMNQTSLIQRAPRDPVKERQTRLNAFLQEQDFLFYFSGERQVLPRQWQRQVLTSFQVPETETPLALLTAQMTGKKANAGLLFGIERVYLCTYEKKEKRIASFSWSIWKNLAFEVQHKIFGSFLVVQQEYRVPLQALGFATQSFLQELQQLLQEWEAG
ncbi:MULTISPECIES: hypothetical protein [Enterococcus]|uniref:hypothetical protein n=1 Tax=Enterococcus TaxID=1350 RepID=UPI0001B6DAA1|nr:MULTISPECIES: hypothetical protein [Enterococcus]EEV29432.1 predicted protein [Enterococcus casseliflavus EC30]EEV36024.1 predicted protein [Enterococcus casseliflavus EC10]MDO0894101.1 hypothetical protein [Enterococcus sp. B1E4]MDO0907055.1 hypothetical protein [Enterococcus sp. B2E4]MDR3826209.1 hypothetical protein [Enterococcus sp.]